MTTPILPRTPLGPFSTLPVDAETCRRLLALALARGGDYADLFFEHRSAGALVFEEGITRQASRSVTLGLGVRVQRGEATGHAHVEDLSWGSLRRAAETAARIAAGGATASVALRSVVLPRRYDLPEASVEVAGTVKRALLERASAAAFAADSRVIRVEATFAEERREILIATSDGRWVHDVQPLFRFGVRVVVAQDGRRESGRSGGGGRTTLGYFVDKSPEAHAAEAVRQAVVNLDARPAPAGQLEVVLAPGDSGILLHEAIGHGLEADFNRRGTSNYSGRVGESVASELCTVVDDATLLHGRGSLNVDDEGVEAGRTVLIDRGTLAGYLQDRLSARHLGVAPTGNGRRESFGAVPMPRMTNTILLAGPHNPAEIVGSVRRGVYARAFGGGQVDISNGDFVFSLTEAYLLEDGKVTAPLKGANLIGNGPETLREVSMLGDDLVVSDGIWTCGKHGQSVPVGVGCPTIKIAKITVGGTEIG